jgi:DNA-binding GntR family transcriptional regulator
MANTSRNDYVQEIYGDLKSKILSGELQHDDRLIEVKTAEAYNASRIHAKEAFRLLETERLVKHIPNRGFIVRGVTNDMIDEIVEIRQALEKVIFKEIIQNATDAELAELARLAKRFEVFVDNEMTQDANKELDDLYKMVYSLSKYKRIVKILSQYSDYIDLIRNLTINTDERLHEGVHNLNDLVTALINRDLTEMERQLELRHQYVKHKD